MVWFRIFHLKLRLHCWDVLMWNVHLIERNKIDFIKCAWAGNMCRCLLHKFSIGILNLFQSTRYLCVCSSFCECSQKLLLNVLSAGEFWRHLLILLVFILLERFTGNGSCGSSLSCLQRRKSPSFSAISETTVMRHRDIAPGMWQEGWWMRFKASAYLGLHDQFGTRPINGILMVWTHWT